MSYGPIRLTHDPITHVSGHGIGRYVELRGDLTGLPVILHIWDRTGIRLAGRLRSGDRIMADGRPDLLEDGNGVWHPIIRRPIIRRALPGEGEGFHPLDA